MKTKAKHTAPPAAPEIETADYLTARGWKKLTYAFDAGRDATGEEWEWEILSDPDGVLWLITEYNGPASGEVTRAERRRITRETACAMLAKASIPEHFRHDFKECHSPRLRLETAIQEASALLLLFAQSDALQDYEGDKGGRLQAGIFSLAHRIGDELAASFYTEENPQS